MAPVIYLCWFFFPCTFLFSGIRWLNGDFSRIVALKLIDLWRIFVCFLQSYISFLRFLFVSIFCRILSRVFRFCGNDGFPSSHVRGKVFSSPLPNAAKNFDFLIYLLSQFLRLFFSVCVRSKFYFYFTFINVFSLFSCHMQFGGWTRIQRRLFPRRYRHDLHSQEFGFRESLRILFWDGCWLHLRKIVWSTVLRLFENIWTCVWWSRKAVDHCDWCWALSTNRWMRWHVQLRSSK